MFRRKETAFFQSSSFSKTAFQSMAEHLFSFNTFFMGYSITHWAMVSSMTSFFSMFLPMIVSLAWIKTALVLKSKSAPSLL